MEKIRRFGRTGRSVSAIGFGAWALGGSWGPTDDGLSTAALGRALERGMSFFDTADVYGDGRSEELVGRACRGRPELLVATKAGRRLSRQTAQGYSEDNLRAWIDRSRQNLGAQTLDLLQLHCPPTELYRSDRAFRILDRLAEEGRIRHYGVSVETIEEARLALSFPGVQSIQIIFNLFRQRPARELFDLARERKVALIARVPLASGLLTGKLSAQSTFPEDDHRRFNIAGRAFDVGETFSGVPWEAGLRAVEELKALVPAGQTLAQFALRWILMHEAVTTVIPGCRTALQVEENGAALDLPPLSPAQMDGARFVYDRHIRAHVEGRW